MPIDPRIRNVLDEHPYPLVFATVSGAHLYGFPSPDSDYDLRGVHLLPLDEILRLAPGRETVEHSGFRDGLEIDLVTHDAKKFFAMLLKRNGYVMEQLFSPLVLKGGPVLDELRAIALGCLTRHHAHHYAGFATTQWKLFEKVSPHRVKPLLYVFRVLLTGIHLMEEGALEANLPTLNKRFQLPYLSDLIALKLTGPENGTIPEADLRFYRAEFDRLMALLEAAQCATRLPSEPAGQRALDDLLVRLRLQGSRRKNQNGREPWN
jgi:predicted nucleotidyltransferase